jgi:RNA polymerase sigma-70 factor (ECF subfamily)
LFSVGTRNRLVDTMDPAKDDSRLSQLATPWSLLARAHQAAAPSVAVRSALAELLERYERVVRRYLRGAVRQLPNREEAAEECFQNFAVRFLSGAFKGVVQERGRFRDYLKSCLLNLVRDYERRRRRTPQPLDEFEPAVSDTPTVDADEEFLRIWRDELLSRTLNSLAEYEQQTGQPLHTVLRFRMAHPEVRSAEMAQQFAGQFGKSLTAVGIRKRLHLARKKFAELLLAEVRQSLDEPTNEDVEQELLDLGLWEHCRFLLE